jgi:CheY-like chemotaxis protein
VLEANGYDVVVAANGVEALQVVKHRRPDIAVVNLGLAELSGLEVARRINDRGDGGRPGAIAVVAVAEMARSGDCAAYLAKPIPVRTFLDTILGLTPPPSPSTSPPA